MNHISIYIVYLVLCLFKQVNITKYRNSQTSYFYTHNCLALLRIYPLFGVKQKHTKYLFGFAVQINLKIALGRRGLCSSRQSRICLNSPNINLQNQRNIKQNTHTQPFQNVCGCVGWYISAFVNVAGKSQQGLVYAN